MGIEPTHVGYNGERDVMGIEYDMYTICIWMCLKKVDLTPKQPFE